MHGPERNLQTVWIRGVSVIRIGKFTNGFNSFRCWIVQNWMAYLSSIYKTTMGQQPPTSIRSRQRPLSLRFHVQISRAISKQGVFLLVTAHADLIASICARSSADSMTAKLDMTTLGCFFFFFFFFLQMMFCASAFRHRNNCAFGLSVRPFVRPIITQMTDQPTKFVRRSKEVSEHFLVDPWGGGLKFGRLMYPDRLQNWWDFVQGLLIFLILAPLWQVKVVKFEISGHFLENTWEELPEMWHADVS